MKGRIEAGQLERIDEPLFPPVALREALVNALCHRDYSIVGGSVSIAIYDDRLEITSTGLLGITRQFFNAALHINVIDRNPFAGREFVVTVGVAKKSYIDTATISKVIEYCPSSEWKLLFAIARYAGPRIPSEIKNIAWDDVDWENNHIRLDSPKTAFKGKSERIVPIFDEVRPYLDFQYDLAGDGELYVFQNLRCNTNLATEARRIVKKAKVPQWPAFWNSLRASCETDLMDSVGLRRACAWIGNTPAVAMKNYALVKKDRLHRADGKRCEKRCCTREYERERWRTRF